MPFDRLTALMGQGYPVGIKFEPEMPASHEGGLFCELIQRARMGETLIFSGQGCPVGSYVLGWNDTDPDEYYFSSGRYKTAASASKAAGSIPRLILNSGSLHIFPLGGTSNDVDVVILFLTPVKAMRLIQALTYHDGTPLMFMTGGTASVCGDCTAAPIISQRMSLSLGCKGSRKHSMYGDEELVAGIPSGLIDKIEEGLAVIPEIYA